LCYTSPTKHFPLLRAPFPSFLQSRFQLRFPLYYRRPQAPIAMGSFCCSFFSKVEPLGNRMFILYQNPHMPPLMILCRARRLPKSVRVSQVTSLPALPICLLYFKSYQPVSYRFSPPYTKRLFFGDCLRPSSSRFHVPSMFLFHQFSWSSCIVFLTLSLYHLSIFSPPFPHASLILGSLVISLFPVFQLFHLPLPCPRLSDALSTNFFF